MGWFSAGAIAALAISAVALLAACETEQLCAQGPIPKVELSLACPEPDPPGLDYVDSRNVILSLLWGRMSTLRLLSDESNVQLVAGGQLFAGELEVDDRTLKLHGGPCTEDCNVTPAFFATATPVEHIETQYGVIELFRVFGGKQLCMPSNGIWEISPGTWHAQLNVNQPGGISAPVLTNPEPMHLTVDFEARRFEVRADLCDVDGSQWGARVRLVGSIDNVPPVAVVGPDQEVDCETPLGTEVTLDASGSWDADEDPLSFIWWEGYPQFGEPVSRLGDPPVIQILSPPGTTDYTVEVFQDLFTDSRATTRVTVRDNCPPEI